MSGYQTQQLILSLILLAAFVCFAVLALSSRRTSSVAAAASSLLSGAVLVALGTLDLSSWRAEVGGALLRELPFIFALSWICLAQAGYLPARLGSVTLETVARRPRLRRVLATAPLILLLSWVVAGAVGLAWPSPAMQSFASAPPQFLLFKWILMLAEATYCGLAGGLFLITAGLDVPVLRLRLKNLAFAVGTFCWLLLALNATIHAAVRVWAPDEIREGIVATQLSLETHLVSLSVVAFCFGLALRFVPSAADALLRRLQADLLPSLDRFESLRWRLVASGKLRGVIRASRYATEAAAREGLSAAETERTLTTIQLVAIMKDCSPDTKELSPEKARELYELQMEIASDKTLATRVGWVKHWRSEAREPENLLSAPLHEALEAALDLTGCPIYGDAADSRGLGRPFWHYLAAVGTVDAGLLDPASVEKKLGEQILHRRARQAYEDARESARTVTVGER